MQGERSSGTRASVHPTHPSTTQLQPITGLKVRTFDPYEDLHYKRNSMEHRVKPSLKSMKALM